MTNREPTQAQWSDIYLEILSLSAQDRADLFRGASLRWARLATILTFREVSYDLPEHIYAHARRSLVFQCTVLRSIPGWIHWHQRREFTSRIFANLGRVAESLESSDSK